MLEVFKQVLVQRGERDALQAVAAMQEGQVVDLDMTVALTTARISADLGLPLADSVILATAQAHEATVWTQDSDFEGIEGLRYKLKAWSIIPHSAIPACAAHGTVARDGCILSVPHRSQPRPNSLDPGSPHTYNPSPNAWGCPVSVGLQPKGEML